jgi:hypothetical protein
MFHGADDEHVSAHDGTGALGALSAPARDDVHEGDKGNDDHGSDGDDGDRGHGEDHTTFLSCRLVVKRVAAIARGKRHGRVDARRV